MANHFLFFVLSLVLKYNRLCVQSNLLAFVFLISKLDYHPLNEMVIKPLFYILDAYH